MKLDNTPEEPPTGMPGFAEARASSTRLAVYCFLPTRLSLLNWWNWWNLNLLLVSLELQE